MYLDHALWVHMLLTREDFAMKLSTVDVLIVLVNKIEKKTINLLKQSWLIHIAFVLELKKVVILPDRLLITLVSDFRKIFTSILPMNDIIETSLGVIWIDLYTANDNFDIILCTVSNASLYIFSNCQTLIER